MARSNQGAGATSSPPMHAAGAVGQGPAAPGQRALLNRLAGWLRRGEAVDDAGPPHQATATAQPIVAPAGDSIVPFGRLGRAPRVLMAVLFGLDPEALEHSLAEIRASSDRVGGEMETVCLTDCDRFELFRRHRLLFEYFPRSEQQRRFASDLDWDLYTLRRLARLRRKWSPVRIVAFGPVAQAQIQLWRASPFEDDHIKDLIRAPDAASAATDVVGN
jgi:hypothetical protein